MSATLNQIDQAWTELKLIAGEHMRPAIMSDAVDGVQPSGVIAPATTQEVAEILRYCNAAGLAVIPRGGGTKLWLGDRTQKADFVLSTERLNQVIEHAAGDMTATVEAGCTIDKFQQTLKEHGQRLAADPMWPGESTVGGLLATAESGTLRIRYGAVRDLVLGLESVLADGSVIKAGGKVVKNVAGYDLTKLAIGSLGTLGVITRAVFRLHPIPVATATYSTTLPSASEANQLVLAILNSQLVYTGVQIRATGADAFAVDIRFEGIPESLQDQFLKLQKVAGAVAFSSAGEVWAARQELFDSATSSMICKCSVLPAQIGSLCDAIFQQAASVAASATLVAQGTGILEMRLDADGAAPLARTLHGLRAHVDSLQGTLIVQWCPLSMKEGLDVWGPIGDALPLMNEIKKKFDPARILNPGRFVGAI
jgi:glycolate oxidase FAD binding subunit